MKTKEFIKMLQEADPKGEAHIRMDGGIPTGAAMIPGYYDGHYEYFDDDGNFVSSIEGDKVDVYCTDIDLFVESNMSSDNSTPWEEIEKKFKFEFGDYVYEDSRLDSKGKILKRAKESYDEYKKIEQGMIDREIEDALKHQKEGWTWFQNKKVDKVKDGKINMHHFYTWKIYNAKGKKQSSTPWNIQGVLLSGKFERLNNRKKWGYYEWKIK